MNDYIKWLQKTLKAFGYDPGPIDGLAGERTAKAVSAFQNDHELAVDGIVGEQTNQALLDALQARINPAPAGIVTPHFDPDEFACSCGCGLDVVDGLKVFAESLRSAFGWPLTISSGARCVIVNREAGGVPDSCHLTGEAFDAYFGGHMNEAVLAQMADFAVSQGIGVIRYPNQRFCHFQVYPRNDVIW
jgi:peptidoglycan hydrolase-like protein with peptidoglycan-binding domain